MIKTPIGNLVTVKKPNCIEIWLADDDGELIDCISFTEYYDKRIATYSYNSRDEDFENKTVYKTISDCKEAV